VPNFKEANSRGDQKNRRTQGGKIMDESLSSAAIALLQIAEPFRFLMLVLGVLLGLVVGVVPGLGGLVGLTLLLPFTFHLDPYTALAVLIGMHAVVATSDSIPAVLFGVPGTVGSAATIVDGYPMSRRGEAGRALGAAFTASMLGGLIGVTMLAIAIPVLRPLMLSIASPEMFAFCIFGISLAASLSGKHVMRGLAAAAIGLVLAMVGEDYQSGTMRWTFDTIYLWSGIPLVPLALGLFAIPEIADLVVKKTSIAGDGTANRQTKGQFIGAKDVLRNPVVLFRSSGIGAVLGALPGLGSAVIDWIAYGATARSRVKNARFGDGDVRGVIASEAANNAKEGGALVPTIAFGVPGSAAMAILLGAFLVHGIVPGPDMLSKDLDVTYTLIFSVAVANLLGAGLCFLFAPSFARVALVPIGILAPIVIAIIFLGAFQGGEHWGDLVVLLGAGVVGYMMRLLSWPRPPLLLGFVLGALIERYLATSVQIYGASFLMRPAVIVILAMTAWGILSPIMRKMLARRKVEGDATRMRFAPSLARFDADVGFGVAVIAFFAAIFISTVDWPTAAQLVPQVVAITGLGVVLIYIAQRLFFVRVEAADAGEADASVNARTSLEMDLKVKHQDLDDVEVRRRSIGYFAWLGGYSGLAVLIGPLLAILIWVGAYMRLHFGLSWKLVLPCAAILFGVAYALFEIVLNANFPQPLLPLL